MKKFVQRRTSEPQSRNRMGWGGEKGKGALGSRRMVLPGKCDMTKNKHEPAVITVITGKFFRDQFAGTTTMEWIFVTRNGCRNHLGTRKKARSRTDQQHRCANELHARSRFRRQAPDVGVENFPNLETFLKGRCANG